MLYKEIDAIVKYIEPCRSVHVSFNKAKYFKAYVCTYVYMYVYTYKYECTS